MLLSVLVGYSLLGVSPDDLERFSSHIIDEGKYFKCFDGSKTITIDKFNDGFSDCDDGSDEPGTGGYTKGFYCKNEGFFPKIISNWDVGNGICDCCDGSDELYNSRITCNNTCKQESERFATLKIRLEEGIKEGLKKRENDRFYSWVLAKLQNQTRMSDLSLITSFVQDKQRKSFIEQQINRYKLLTDTVSTPKHPNSLYLTNGLNLGHFRRVFNYTAEFSGGSQCYIRGISRMTKIRYVCWKEEKLSSFRHVKACEHEATMGTPAVCLDESVIQLNPDTILPLLFLIDEEEF